MFSSEIKDLRLRRGISQKELAEAVFISSSAISQYENGRNMPGRETLARLAEYFGVSIKYLTGDSPCPDVESLLVDEYVEGVPMSEFIKLCASVTPEDRATVLKIVRNLSVSDEPILSHKKQKICR